MPEITGRNGLEGARRPRVVVAMSGGVDSSVAAALLVEQGYDVIGLMLRLWSEPGQEGHNRCCTPNQMGRARQVAERLGIPFYTLDVKDYFRRAIVQFFLDEYTQGRTPNPCLECNRHIRFGFLLHHALALEADYLATGHYAQIIQTADGYELHQGVDVHKDQSYVLHVLGQAELAHTLLPVGGYTKPEVRQLAAAYNLPVVDQSESMDLCFLGHTSYHDFLHRHAPESAAPGPIVDTQGRTLGTHTGLAFYTIGQRKGLGIAAPEPLFVLGKDQARNALVVGRRAEMGQSHLLARRVNWIAGAPPAGPTPAEVRIRYRGAAQPAVVIPQPQAQAEVHFETPTPGIAPGQGAVFYQGTRCLGGGIIADAT